MSRPKTTKHRTSTLVSRRKLLSNLNIENVTFYLLLCIFHKIYISDKYVYNLMYKKSLNRIF